MLTIVKRTVLPAILALAMPAPFAMAQPACSQSNAGARMCMTGEACTCAYDRGGQLTATPPGWRWSCSLLETCGTRLPATINDGQNNYPMMIEPNIELPGAGNMSRGPSY